MTEKSGKKKTKKGAKAAADPSVLGTLRSTRPSRIGSERRGASATSAKASASKPAAARAKRSSPGTTAPTRARTPTPKATAPKPAAATRPEPPPPPRPPEPPPWPRDRRPSGTELVTTAVQAVGEIAQIGVTVGRQVLKRAAGRIPRP